MNATRCVGGTMKKADAKSAFLCPGQGVKLVYPLKDASVAFKVLLGRITTSSLVRSG